MYSRNTSSSHEHGLSLLFCALIFILGCSPETVELNETKITVEVMDQFDHPYPDIVLGLMQDDAMQKMARSDQNGIYTFLNLDEGPYDISAKIPLASELDHIQPMVMNIQKGEHAKIDLRVIPQVMNAELVYGDHDLIDEVKNENGQMPTGENERLYARNWHQAPLGSLHPILTPDGQHVTLAQWKQASGTAVIHCDGHETHYAFEFRGLIPNGIYTLWVMPLKAHETFESFTYDSMIGNGALGTKEQNSFVYFEGSESTQKYIQMRGGQLSVSGTIHGCALTNEQGLLIVLDYHIDKKTHGDIPGPDKTEVGQLLFLL